MPSAPLEVLDVGGGTGELAADLARVGHALTLLDFSPAMIKEAQRRCTGLDVTFKCADVTQVKLLFEAESFDVAVCHSVLEFLEDPALLLRQLAQVVRTGGLISIVVGNRYHLPLRAALLAQDFRLAQLGLEQELPATDLFGLPRRTFYPEDVHNMIKACKLRQLGAYGVRVFSDLLGDTTELTPELLALELAASSRLPYCHLARFIQFITIKE
jgi:SAM-dependent methyltransferase